MSDSGSAIVATAAGQIGVDDGDCPGRGCYLGNGGEWCSEFVSWCYEHAGHPFSDGGESGWHIVKFADGGKLCAHESGFRVIDNRA